MDERRRTIANPHRVHAMIPYLGRMSVIVPSTAGKLAAVATCRGKRMSDLEWRTDLRLWWVNDWEIKRWGPWFFLRSVPEKKAIGRYPTLEKAKSAASRLSQRLSAPPVGTQPLTNEEIDRVTDPLTRDGHYQDCFDEDGEPTCGRFRCEIRFPAPPVGTQE